MSDHSQAVRLVRRMSHDQRAAVLRALLTAGISEATRPARPPAAGASRAGQGWMRIGDEPSLTHYATLFDSAAWRAVWRPGAEFHVYVVGCSGLEGIAAAIDMAVAKAGTCAIGGLDRRLGELRGREYGSVVRHGSGYVAESGWSDWAPFAKLQLGVTPSACPIRPAARSMIVTAPLGWTPGEVEQIVNGILAPFRLQRFADSDAGRALSRERGVDPTTLMRYSRKGRSVAAATELTLVRARVDAPRLAGLIAGAIARRLRATALDPHAAPWRVLDPPDTASVMRPVQARSKPVFGVSRPLSHDPRRPSFLPGQSDRLHSAP